MMSITPEIKTATTKVADIHLIALQTTAGDNVEANLAAVAIQLGSIDFSQFDSKTAAGDMQRTPVLILLPENFALFAGPDAYFQHAETLGEGPIQAQLARWAQDYQCWLVAGALPIRSANAERIYTTSLAFAPDGRLVQHYHKVHLFDATVPRVSTSAAQVYRESDSFIAGDRIATFTAAGVKFGMAICYDLRFPELFRLLRAEQVEVLLLPAAFTYSTGAAHWLPLLQARAIENQCYVLAANQVGQHSHGRMTWGHSVILDPWGQILAQQTSQCGVCCAPLYQSKLVQIRTDMPVLQQARFAARLHDKE